MAKKKHTKKNINIQPKEKNKEILVDVEGEEQRRTTRVGSIIAVVAVIGTLCAFLFKMTIKSLNIWSKVGMYWYLKALFVFSLSTSVIIFIDIVFYVIGDLKRYNLLDINYKQYDQESDKRYMYLIEDFKIYIILLFFLLLLSIPISAIYCGGIQKIFGIILSIFFVIGIFACVWQWLKHSKKYETKKIVSEILKKFLKWIFVAVVCFCMSGIFNIPSKALVNINYNVNGIVEICNTSAESYNGLDIKISTMNGETIFTKSVEKEELLFAKEDKYVNNGVNGKRKEEGILLNCEYLHWKYTFDLNKVINEPGRYIISIIVYQDGKNVHLINSLSAEQGEYIFTQDVMEKEY